MKNPNSKINEVLELMVSHMKISEIKEKTKNYDEFYLEYGVGITPKEWEWLIKQAEKVERYEKAFKLEMNIKCSDFEEVKQMLKTQQQIIEHLEKALKQIHETAMNSNVDEAMVYGYVAKRALEGIR